MKELWSETASIKDRPCLGKDIETDIVVIGAGLAGILIAYMLKKHGREVVIVEARKPGSGNTRNTTAKITSQHELIYNKIIKEFGVEKASHYATLNELAIKKYRNIIEEEKIDCDFEEKDAYVYSLDKIEEIEKETTAAKSLGIDAEFTDKCSLPFKVKGAVKFKNQAQFNAYKFVSALSEDLTIYGGTKAIDIEDDKVFTDKGVIKAKHIVVATHYPFVNVPGYYFLRMHQERSYVVAIEDADDVEGMYIDMSKDGYSFRNYKNLLLLGGIPQRTGENEKGGAYDALIKKAKELYPHCNIKYYWSAQDCMTHDGIPFIGQYSKTTPNMYVATGFNKWGMTSSMVAAMIITDKILGKENEYADIFSPTRVDISLSINNLMKDGIETTKNFIAQKIHVPKETIDHIKNGHGGIVEYEGEKVGVYKDENGKVYLVTTKCPHLGCELKWNADELSWDCPCHGSRFDYKGNWLDAPATLEIY